MSAPTIVSALLPVLGLINGIFMALSPAKAGTKIYKFDEKEIKPQVIDLIQANGASALSVAVLETILSFTSTDYSKAVAIAMIPRFIFLIYSLTRKTKTGAEMLEPRNLMQIVVATILIEGRWMNPTLSLQVRGGLYIFLGVLFTIVPSFIAKRSKQFEANPTTERCLRARGKMDIVFGTVVWCLATMPYMRALGITSLAWFASSLYSDFLISTRDRFRSDAFAQLFIALVSAMTLLTI